MTATSAILSVEDAIASAIVADTGAGGVATLLAGSKVYNLQAPKESRFPYVVIGDAGEIPSRWFGRDGRSADVTLHVFAQKSPEVVYTIYAALVALLDNALLSVAGHTMIVGALALVSVLMESDGRTYHLIARYTATTQVGP